jgi:hypothetical protein
LRRVLLALLVLGVVGAVAFWLLTMPRVVPASELPPRPNAVPKSEQTKDEDRPEPAGEGGNGEQEHDTPE